MSALTYATFHSIAPLLHSIAPALGTAAAVAIVILLAGPGFSQAVWQRIRVNNGPAEAAGPAGAKAGSDDPYSANRRLTKTAQAAAQQLVSRWETEGLPRPGETQNVPELENYRWDWNLINSFVEEANYLLLKHKLFVTVARSLPCTEARCCDPILQIDVHSRVYAVACSPG